MYSFAQDTAIAGQAIVREEKKKRERTYKLAKREMKPDTVSCCEQGRSSEFCILSECHSRKSITFLSLLRFFSGAFRLYDVDNDGFITRDEMYNIVDAIYQMVVSASPSKRFARKPSL